MPPPISAGGRVGPGRQHRPLPELDPDGGVAAGGVPAADRVTERRGLLRALPEVPAALRRRRVVPESIRADLRVLAEAAA